MTRKDFVAWWNTHFDLLTVKVTTLADWQKKAADNESVVPEKKKPGKQEVLDEAQTLRLIKHLLRIQAKSEGFTTTPVRSGPCNLR